MNSDFLTIAFRRICTRFRQYVDKGDEDNDDALQEAFCRLWGKKTVVSDLSHAEGLLVKTTRNIRIDELRERTAHPTVNLSEFADPPWVPDDDDVTEIYDRVNRIATQHLTDRDREILYKREQEGRTFSDIANEYNLSEANVRMIVSRSRKTLRSLYRNNSTNI